MSGPFVFFLVLNGCVYAMWRWPKELCRILMHLSRACECGRSWRRCTDQWKLR